MIAIPVSVRAESPLQFFQGSRGPSFHLLPISRQAIGNGWANLPLQLFLNAVLRYSFAQSEEKRKVQVPFDVRLAIPRG